MFKHFKIILPCCRFPRGNIGQQMNASRFQIDLYGANAGNEEHYRNGETKLQALGRKNIVWSRNQYLTGDKIKGGNYDFLLLVPSPPGFPWQPLKWGKPSPGSLQGGTLETIPLEKTHWLKGKAWRQTDVIAINKLHTFHPVLPYSACYFTINDYTLELRLHYKTSSIAFRTLNYYFDKAANQVRACVHGFIEEELHGKSEDWWRLGGITAYGKKPCQLVYRVPVFCSVF
jgi:hypothetical protein